MTLSKGKLRNTEYPEVFSRGTKFEKNGANYLS